MVGMNVVILVGRLAKDPEERTYRNKHYTTFSLAVERPAVGAKDKDKKAPVDFIPCVCWNENIAEFIARNGAKGALCGVTGRMTYEVKKLESGYRVNSSVTVNNIHLFEYKRQDNDPINTANLPEYTSSSYSDESGRLDPNDDLPF